MNTAKDKREVADAIKTYYRNGFKSIWDLYDRPSYAKECIYNDLSKGHNNEVLFATCLSGNCSHFTMLRIVADDETGEILVIKETHANSYTVSFAELNPTDQQHFAWLL